MYSPGRLSVAVPRQDGRTLPVVVQTNSVIDQRAAGRTPRLAGTRVRLTAVGPNNEAAAAESIVLEASSGQTGAPSEVLIEEARRRISVTEEIKACHPPEPAVVVEVV
jgi:hypothetical protein